MQRLFTNFLKGILILAPMLVTGWVIYTIFTKIDGLLGISITGLGFVITIVFIILVGALASNVFFTRLFNYFEKVLTRLPVVKLLYFSIKDLIGAFVGEKKMFNRPVMVDMAHLPLAVDNPVSPPGKDIKLLGFITSDTLEFLPEAGDRVAVYMPQSYNMGGYMMLVPKERITPLASAESAKLLAFIVSGGVARGNS
ncbi:MAG: conserved hypothetical rane protein [Fibrobacteres bacterium]|nr:conserved hypothetical rane protein [Fibrobacterota bacterium]